MLVMKKINRFNKIEEINRIVSKKEEIDRIYSVEG
jgi:hypothetical protein